MSVAIRAATPEDAEWVSACVEAAYRPYLERIGRPPGPMLDDYAGLIARHHVYLAEEGGAPAGLVVLIDKSDRLLLDNVAVLPERQGRGVGGELIAFAEAEARRRGFAVIELYTHIAMTENRERYRRLGYRETERRTELGLERVYLRKELPPAGDGPGGS